MFYNMLGNNGEEKSTRRKYDSCISYSLVFYTLALFVIAGCVIMHFKSAIISSDKV